MDIVCNVCLVCAALLSYIVSIAPTVQGDSWRCPRGLSHTTAIVSYQDKCFQFVNKEKYWDDASEFCQENGGRLAKIDSAETNSFIVETLNSLTWTNNGVWIGMHDRDKELHWTWATGQADVDEAHGHSWTNWGRGHPKAFLHSARDCVRMVRGRGRWHWHETFCHSLSWKYRFICQYRMQATTTVEPLTRPLAGDVAHLFGVAGNMQKSTPEGDSQKGLAGAVTTPNMSRTGKTTQKRDEDNVIDGAAFHFLKDNGSTSSSWIYLTVIACLAVLLIVTILILIIFIRRRKRKSNPGCTKMYANQTYSHNLLGGETCLTGGDDRSGDNMEGCGNQYVINVYANPMERTTCNMTSSCNNRSATDNDNRVNLDIQDKRGTYKMMAGDGYEEPIQTRGQLPTIPTDTLPHYLPMDGTRRPIPALNVYAEIPGGDDSGLEDNSIEEENVYEALDDIGKDAGESCA